MLEQRRGHAWKAFVMVTEAFAKAIEAFYGFLFLV